MFDQDEEEFLDKVPSGLKAKKAGRSVGTPVDPDLNLVLSLIQSDYYLVDVVFGSGRRYTYKCPSSISVEKGDQVVIPRLDSFIVSEVWGIRDRSEVDSSINYKWVIQKIDLTEYRERLAAEELFVQKMKKLRKLQEQQKVLDQYESLTGVEKRLFDEAVSAVVTPKLENGNESEDTTGG